MDKLKRLTKKKIKNILWILCGKKQEKYDKVIKFKTKIKQLQQKILYQKACKKGRTMSLDIRELFISNAADGRYERLDTVVRYLTIKKYFSNDANAFHLYHKMQEKRLGDKKLADDWCDRFRNLIKSFEHDGYDQKYVLTVGDDLQIHDGSHRTALCLYNHIFVVPCKIIKYHKKVEYGLDWFIKNQFDRKEIEEILTGYNELLKEYRSEYYLTVESNEKDMLDKTKELLEYIGSDCQYIKLGIDHLSGKTTWIYRFHTASDKYILENREIVNMECLTIKKMVGKIECADRIDVCLNFKSNNAIKEKWGV